MSFKIVRGASEFKYLTTSSFPTTGTGTTTNFTLFGWMKVVTASKWSRLMTLYTFEATALDYLWIGRESTGPMRGAVLPYGQTSAGFSAGSLSSNTWIAYCLRTQLGTDCKMIATGVSEQTDSTFGSPWHGGPSTEMFKYFRIGAIYNGTDDASMTVNFAHCTVYKARLSDGDVTSLMGGANPLAIDASNILEYWSGASLTGYNGTVLSESGSGTFTADDADNPTVDDPPGGGSAVPLLMQMYHGG